MDYRWYLIIFALFMSINVTGQNPSLSNVNATEPAQNLYKELKMLSTDYVLFGHQDDMAYGVKWWNIDNRSDVKEVSGSYPAVFGWEIGHIGEKRNIDSVEFADIAKWIKQADSLGGINTISWHMKNPITKTTSWDTQNAVEHILPGGKLHDYYKLKLDLVANFLSELKNLKGEQIPIIFRPFHEANGSWFWWGGKNCLPENYMELWKFTKDYLENTKSVNNIIWCFSTDRFYTISEYLKYYPGDEYVDIIGFDDIVSPQHNIKHFSWEIKTIVSIALEKGKLATISETGCENIHLKKWWTKNLNSGINSAKKGRGISYVLAWRNSATVHFFAPYAGHPSSSDFVKFRKNKNILFLDDLNLARKELIPFKENQ